MDCYSCDIKSRVNVYKHCIKQEKERAREDKKGARIIQNERFVSVEYFNGLTSLKFV